MLQRLLHSTNVLLYTIVAWKESAPATFRDRKEGEEAATSNPTKRRKVYRGLKKSPQRKNCKQEDCLHILGLLNLSKSATAVKRNIPESYVFVVVESMICQLRSIVRHRGRLLKIPRYGSLVPPPFGRAPSFPHTHPPPPPPQPPPPLVPSIWVRMPKNASDRV